MNRAGVTLIGLALVCISFGAGYFVADRRAESLASELQFGALTHDIAAIAYLRRGQVENARSILYVAVDGPLSTFSSDNASSLSPESRKFLSELLWNLNAAWAEDKPFEGEQFASLRSMSDWAQMRARNDEFRRRFAQVK